MLQVNSYIRRLRIWEIAVYRAVSKNACHSERSRTKCGEVEESTQFRHFSADFRCKDPSTRLRLAQDDRFVRLRNKLKIEKAIQDRARICNDPERTRICNDPERTRCQFAGGKL